jgi:multidrug efflux system membrane fusion protein
LEIKVDISGKVIQHACHAMRSKLIGTTMTIRSQRIARRVLLTGSAISAIILGGFYTEHGRQVSQAAPVSAPPAVPVLVHTVAPQSVRVWSEFSGRLHAVDSAEIRPQVSGRITQVLFQDGQTVKAGDLLYVIDPRPYQAAVEQAEANLASAKANAGFAKVEFQRAAGMIGAQAIAKSVYDQRADADRVAEAAVEGAQAALDQAQINLDYAHVRAPISGRASRAEITIGNLVQAGPGAPLLTTIVSNDGIYADFEVDEQTYIDNIRNVAKGRDAERLIPVELTIAGDTARSYQGKIYTFDNQIDVASGTIRARAKFDNTDGALVPGMFVTVRLASGSSERAMLIPDQAVSFDQSKKFVLVVGTDNKVAYREVELGQSVGPERIALGGIQPGERVIVDGIQHVMPGMVVAPQEAPSQPQSASR